jgi:hypothetical protein
MNGKLRHVVAGVESGRLLVDEIAESVVEAVFARDDAHLRQRIFQPERNQFARRVRQDIDPDADRLSIHAPIRRSGRQSPRDAASGPA